MTRKEQILIEAIDYSFVEDNYLEYDDCGDICDDRDFIQKAFESGAKWADEHPNLYNDEKYHTVKVSCLDELNRKAVLYDTFLEKACEWWEQHTVDYDLYDIWNKDYVSFKSLIMDFREAMEE